MSHRSRPHVVPLVLILAMVTPSVGPARLAPEPAGRLGRSVPGHPTERLGMGGPSIALRDAQPSDFGAPADPIGRGVPSLPHMSSWGGASRRFAG
jgi:hypothetical protein